jgi:tetratricopeptide (TPR) repeat protein
MMIGSNFKPGLYLFIFSLFFLKSYSQDTIDAAEIETKTLEFYTNKNWNSLISLGNEGLKNGNDYFYLRMRIGIAYYEQKNYCLALVHFKKAIDFNATDDLANEYLYYSYTFIGKEEEARKLSSTFSSKLKEKLGLNNTPLIDFITVSGGSKIANSSFSDSNNAIYFEQANFFELAMKHYIKNKFSLFHAFNTFNQEIFVGKINQNQYYALASIPLKNNWSLAPAFHVFQLNFTGEILGTNSETTTSNYFVSSFLVIKTYNKFHFSIGSTISNTADIEKSKQYNHFANVTYSVFGNSQLVLGFTDYLHTTDNYDTLNNSFSTFVSFEPLNFITIKLSYFKNLNKNIIEQNGYLINNSIDLTTNRLSVLANFRLNKTFSIFTLYQLENKELYQQNSDYQYNVLMAGIKINSLF